MSKPFEKVDGAAGVSPLRRYLPAVLIFCAGIGLTIWVFNIFRDWQWEHIEHAFNEQAAIRIKSVQNSITSSLEVIHAIDGLFAASESVERDEFREFTGHLLAHHPYIQALEWIPRVRDSERAAYEETARNEGLAGFEITRRDEQGKMVRDKQREEYVPVYYIEPLAGNEAAVGFNLASNPVRLKTLEKARDTGAVTGTARIVLIQETGEQFGFLVFNPVYRKGASRGTIEERRENLMGFALGVFRIEDMIEKPLEGLETGGIDIHVYDETAEEDKRFLFSRARPMYMKPEGYEEKRTIEEKEDILAGLHTSITVDAGGREWQVLAHPTQEFIASEKTLLPWMILTAGIFTTLITLFYILNASDKTVKLQIEIRERKRAEKEQQKLVSLVEKSTDFIVIASIEGQVTFVNKAGLELVGLKSIEETASGRIFDFFPERDHAALREKIIPGMMEKGLWEGEFQLRHFKTGRTIPVAMSAFTINHPDTGETIAIANISRDITETKRYRKELEKMVGKRTAQLKQSLSDAGRARDWIDGILKSVADGLIVTDIYNRVVLMNRAAENLLDVRFSEMIDRPIDFAINDKTLLKQFRDTLKKKATDYKFDFELPGEDPKRPRIMRARISVIHGKEGKQAGIVTILHDVTSEREVDRMKTEFLSTAAHELKTPLTSIQGFSEVLLTSDRLSSGERKKFLIYINTQAEVLGKIISDLLDISRIESGKSLVLNRVKCIAGEGIRSVVPYFENSSPKHRFEVVLPDKEVELFVDKKKMEQVLMNLLSNAVKFSPEGGLVRVSGEVDVDEYRVKVEDEGIGMTAEQLDRVFDKFHRADMSNTAVEGPGLGMTIVKHIVDAHGGEVKVESEYGKGTKVTFNLPMKGKNN